MLLFSNYLILTGFVLLNLLILFLIYLNNKMKQRMFNMCEVMERLADDCGSGEIVHSYGDYPGLFQLVMTDQYNKR